MVTVIMTNVLMKWSQHFTCLCQVSITKHVLIHYCSLRLIRNVGSGRNYPSTLMNEEEEVEDWHASPKCTVLASCTVVTQRQSFQLQVQQGTARRTDPRGRSALKSRASCSLWQTSFPLPLHVGWVHSSFEEVEGIQC